MSNKVIIGVIVFVVILSGIFFMGKTNTTSNVVLSAIDKGENIQIPLSQVLTEAQFLDYDGIEYFVVKTEDGTVKVAFDACDVCYKAKKGYSQKGEDMVCNNCGNHYAISGLGTRNLKGGGCWPGYLASKVEGDYLVIKKSALEAGRNRF